jgi:hypothetical protein
MTKGQIQQQTVEPVEASGYDPEIVHKSIDSLTSFVLALSALIGAIATWKGGRKYVDKKRETNPHFLKRKK